MFSVGIEREHGTEMIEAVAQRCSVKKLFLDILQNSQENTCARASFLIKLQAFWWLTAVNYFCQVLRLTCFWKSLAILWKYNQEYIKLKP